MGVMEGNVVCTRRVVGSRQRSEAQGINNSIATTISRSHYPNHSRQQISADLLLKNGKEGQKK
jgi:hypothetical protein